MSNSAKSRTGFAIVAGLILVAVIAGQAFWSSQSGDAEQVPLRSTPPTEAAPSSEPVPPPNDLSSVSTIAEHGRLRLSVDSLPTEGALALVLALPDDARGSQPQLARIISVDGRRLDLTTQPRSGTDGGVQLDIDVEFLSQGLYMIEVQTVETTPIHLRRYVLELE